MPESDYAPEVIICADADEIARRAADRIVAAARAAVEARGRFTLVLSGGSTPEKLYGLLAASPYADQIPWNETFLFVGDERFVPYDDPASNYGMAKRTLLSHAPVPPGNVLPITTTDLATPADAADSYDQAIRDFFNEYETVPAFDLVLLGLGDDGHTASLFPGKPALAETEHLAAGTEPSVLPPPVDRITLTFPALNAARAVLFLAAGAKKAPALREILSGTADINTHPAAGVHPSNGTLTFLIDRSAHGE